MADFIGRAALETIANKFSPQIIMGAARFRPDVFTRMKINIETGVQYQSTKTVMLRKGHTTQKKVVGDEVNSTAGILVERKCITSLAWNRYKDNRDNYREHAIVDTDDSTKFSYPLSEIAMMACIANYGEDIFDCLWHGDESIDRKDKTNPKWYLHIMDGYMTYLAKDVAKGYISKDFHNYVEIGAIDNPADKDDTSAYEEFLKFRAGWHQNLKNAAEVLVYCSEETGAAIARAYMNANGGNDKVRYQADDTYKFPEWRNVVVVPESSFGTGDKMIATVPYNFDYCVDTADARNGIHVQEGSDKDALDIFFQPQSVQGVRVVNISPSSFCMSNGSLAPNDLAGDYTKDVFVVTSNDATLGTVTVNGATPDNTVGYAAGTTLTLKATASEGVFQGWSDGVTTAERSVVTKDMLRAKEQAIISGDGNGKPTGILTGTVPEGQAIEVAALSYQALCDAEAALPQEYEANAKWAMTKKMFMKFISMVDDRKQPIARVNYGIDGKPERYLLGREVICTAAMANQPVDAMIYDFSDYILNSNYNLGIKHAQDWDNEDHKTKAVESCDGKSIDNGSLVTLKVTA